jgi:hypothetical protein
MVTLRPMDKAPLAMMKLAMDLVQIAGEDDDGLVGRPSPGRLPGRRDRFFQ